MPTMKAPTVLKGSVIRPEFCVGTESSFGAYGCIVAAEQDELLVLTALHVLDEVSKRHGIDTTVANLQYTGQELPRAITRVNLYDALEEKWMFHWMGAADEMLVLPDARSNMQEPLSFRDISAFVANRDATVKGAPLAMEAPGVGEPVWLAANFGRGSRSRPAVVVEKREVSYVFRFADASAGPRYTSGAPILNAQGEIVGINVGAGCFDGHHFGHAIQAENIRSHLPSGLKAGNPRSRAQVWRR